jgi:hypothetical protein
MLTDVESSENRQLSRAEKRDRAAGSAGMSLLIPGLGQLLQRRFAAAAIQCGAAATYAVATIGVGSGRAAFLAIAWNVWSAVDAYWHDRP